MDMVRVLLEGLASQGIGLLSLIAHYMDTVLILLHGNESQKHRWLPELASGSFACFALTEADAGSNTYRISTLALKEGDRYIINGQKIFITGAKESKYMLLVARTIPYKDVKVKSHGISVFFIDSHAKGISMEPIDLVRFLPETQYIVYFDNVVVSSDCLIGEQDLGLKVLFDALNPERIFVASLSIGIGRYVLNKSVKYAKSRVIFNDPIGSYQAVQHMLARAFIELEQAELTLQRAIELFCKRADAREVGTYANMAKLAASEAATRACDAAMQIHGGYGFTKEYGLVTAYLGARLSRVAPLNNEMILNYIGTHALGLPRSYK